MFESFREIYKFRDVIYNFVSQELKVKYKGSFLGFFWSLLNPLLTMTVTSIVFASIMKFQLKDFIVFVFSAMLPWGFIAASIDGAANSIINAEGYIKKVYLPKMVFPISNVLSNFINTMFSMISLIIILLFIGYDPKVTVFFLPISFLIIILMSFGFSLILSTLTVFFRDMRYIIGVVLSTLFYLTAIIYPIEAVPKPYSYLIKFNPFYHFIMLFRDPLYYGKMPSLSNVLICLIITFVVLFLGIVIFRKNEKKFVYKL